MAMRAALVAALVAACGPKGPPPTCSPDTPSLCGGGDLHPAAAPAHDAGIDAPAPSQDEKLAAIQKAMNELDEAAQICWAAAATDRFEIAGELKLLIEIAATSAKAQVVGDTARNPKLAACLVQLLGGYRWAPPLHGDTIQLPFKFAAPAGQSVIDRKLVEWRGQDKLSVAVLLDEANSGNPAASILEIAIAAGGNTGARIAERTELWYFLTPAKVVAGRNAVLPRIEPGDMMYVPKGAVRDVVAKDGELKAVIVVSPGGREGVARAGALPTPEYTPTKQAPSPPKLLRRAAAKTYGPATIFLEPAVVKDAPFSASILMLAADAKVPEHVHANETELLYVLEGSGTMTLAGQDVAVTPTSVVQVPANTKHAFAATSAVRALQLYTPAGPEQRFKTKP